jgi:hypothetical protein
MKRPVCNVQVHVNECQEATCRTWELLKHSRMRAVRSSKAGRARQMNVGAAIARGQLLCFVHADTRLCKDAVNVVRCEVRPLMYWVL